jgi:hypothetical protein
MATQADQTNTGVVTTIVVVGAFAMISISAMVTAMVRSERETLDGERPTNADLDTVAALDKQQLSRLTAAPAWVADPGGKVHIPIERAMSLVVEQYKRDPASASPPPPPGMQMPPSTPAGAPVPGQPVPAAPSPANPSGAAPSPAVPNAAAPDPHATTRVVPPPSAPGPAAAPQPAGRP